jgi:hypothetical protein
MGGAFVSLIANILRTHMVWLALNGKTEAVMPFHSSFGLLLVLAPRILLMNQIIDLRKNIVAMLQLPQKRRIDFIMPDIFRQPEKPQQVILGPALRVGNMGPGGHDERPVRALSQ